jgi:hypothetical protein
MARPTAFRCVTSNIEKIAFLFTLRACVRWYRGCNKIPALATLPVSQAAFGAYITGKFTFSGMTTMGTFKIFFFIFHFFHLQLYLWSPSGKPLVLLKYPTSPPATTRLSASVLGRHRAVAYRSFAHFNCANTAHSSTGKPVVFCEGG